MAEGYCLSSMCLLKVYIFQVAEKSSFGDHLGLSLVNTHCNWQPVLQEKTEFAFCEVSSDQSNLLMFFQGFLDMLLQGFHNFIRKHCPALIRQSCVKSFDCDVPVPLMLKNLLENSHIMFFC